MIFDFLLKLGVVLLLFGFAFMAIVYAITIIRDLW